MVNTRNPRTAAVRFAALSREAEQSDSYQIEAAKVEIAEQIYVAMRQQGVANAELARRLGKSRAYVTKVLQGSTNFTLESLVKISRVLDCQLEFQFAPRRSLSELDKLWEAGRRSAPRNPPVTAVKTRSKVTSKKRKSNAMSKR